MTNTVYIALGGNIGDRAAFIHAALDALKAYVSIEETSHLYETQPMHVTDQPLFLNAVCRGTTRLTPPDLLRAVKRTENELGRTKTVRYGPRNVDLDILFYDDAVVDTPSLTIPHIRIPERDFVLAPLLDLEPDLRHPRLDLTVRQLWDRLEMPMPPRVMPLGDRIWHWSQPTRVMAILNMTPDSFSGDGLAGAPDPVDAACTLARQFAANGADAIDVGGYSTRPGHADISIEEEIGRVAPVISALRKELDLPLSIDTFRVEVAEAALDAGAVWLNDVSGFPAAGGPREDALQTVPAMAALAARRRVPLVLMDNRAPLHVDNRHRDANYGTPAADIVSEVRRQLDRALELARRAGVARWHRVIDPGIGFGKSVSQHAALIRRLDELTALGYPLLFGASRKGFLGKLAAGAPVDDRLAATIAANVLAVERGARIVRVHDVRENVQALRVACAVLADAS
ncbi:MAG: dihydropteroate synthase [Caldilineaceae bacterium]|nr:dihydropteroate synthase [Caldilineaceae bacterium]